MAAMEIWVLAATGFKLGFRQGKVAAGMVVIIEASKESILGSWGLVIDIFM